MLAYPVSLPKIFDILFLSYLSLESANQQSIENLTCLVAVADVLESLGCVLTADVEEDFLTTTKFQAAVLANMFSPVSPLLKSHEDVCRASAHQSRNSSVIGEEEAFRPETKRTTYGCSSTKLEEL